VNAEMLLPALIGSVVGLRDGGHGGRESRSGTESNG
jgi:hypothetical protein